MYNLIEVLGRIIATNVNKNQRRPDVCLRPRDDTFQRASAVNKHLSLTPGTESVCASKGSCSGIKLYRNGLGRQGKEMISPLLPRQIRVK